MVESNSMVVVEGKVVKTPAVSVEGSVASRPETDFD